MPEVHSGDNCIIGIEAFVPHDILDNTVAAGIPTKAICSIEEFYERHKAKFVMTKNMNEKEKRDFLIK